MDNLYTKRAHGTSLADDIMGTCSFHDTVRKSEMRIVAEMKNMRPVDIDIEIEMCQKVSPDLKSNDDEYDAKIKHQCNDHDGHDISLCDLRFEKLWTFCNELQSKLQQLESKLENLNSVKGCQELAKVIVKETDNNSRSGTKSNDDSDDGSAENLEPISNHEFSHLSEGDVLGSMSNSRAPIRTDDHIELSNTLTHSRHVTTTNRQDTDTENSKSGPTTTQLKNDKGGDIFMGDQDTFIKNYQLSKEDSTAKSVNEMKSCCNEFIVSQLKESGFDQVRKHCKDSDIKCVVDDYKEQIVKWLVDQSIDGGAIENMEKTEFKHVVMANIIEDIDGGNFDGEERNLLNATLSKLFVVIKGVCNEHAKLCQSCHN